MKFKKRFLAFIASIFFMKHSMQDFTKGDIGRQVIHFSTPLMLGNALLSVYGMINLMWVGRLLGNGAGVRDNGRRRPCLSSAAQPLHKDARLGLQDGRIIRDVFFIGIQAPPPKRRNFL
jgi:hypothetical protein